MPAENPRDPHEVPNGTATGSPPQADAPTRATVVQTTPPHHLLGDAAEASAATPGLVGRFQLGEELARGGMGVVYRASEPSIGRKVAVKLINDQYRGDPRAVARFLGEARITGQLQHPGIPPVFEVGTLPDGSPFLAMKLIKGRTLEDLLKERSDPSHERGRFVAIFEQVAQAVGFAHSRGVIHRDLKPANVMVGSFGEVQVMDWGLAKVLTETQPSTLGPDEATIGTAIRSQRDAADGTRAGSAMGTPQYMPQEQAIGAVDQTDERSDVFGLGGVLCVILTGHPPYLAAGGEAARQMAARGELADTFGRLDHCGAEPELVDLCRRCLNPTKGHRPRNAGEVAKAVAELRAAADERARQAELDRVRAAEQQKRARVQLLLAGAVLLLTVGGGAFAWWQERQRANEARLEGERDAEARNKAEQARPGVRAGLALAVDLRRQYKFGPAGAALAQAAELAKSGAPDLLAEVEQARSDLAFVVRLDDIRSHKWMRSKDRDEKGGGKTMSEPPEYRQAFAERGLDLEVLDPAEAARRIAAYAIKAELVAGVEDWTLWEPDENVRDRLLEVARLADPGPWPDQLRHPAVWKDKDALRKLAAEADPANLSSVKLRVLTTLMWRQGLDPSSLLSRARAWHPTDFELAMGLGEWHSLHGEGGREVEAFEAARALRPDSWSALNNLGVALLRRGHREEACVVLEAAVRHNPKSAVVRSHLGAALALKGDAEGAVTVLKEALELDPKDAHAHRNLGNALREKKDLEGAITAHREAIRLDPKRAQAHLDLGEILYDRGDLDGAAVAFRTAAELDPKHLAARYNLGNTLRDKQDLDGAIVAYNEAIRLDPTFTWPRVNLGIVLHRKGDLDGAITAYREALRLDPKDAHAHRNLGNALRDKKDLDGAVAAFNETIRLDPKVPDAHYNLGKTLYEQRNLDGAVAAFRKAIELAPKDTLAHNVQVPQSLLSCGLRLVEQHRDALEFGAVVSFGPVDTVSGLGDGAERDAVETASAEVIPLIKLAHSAAQFEPTCDGQGLWDRLVDQESGPRREFGCSSVAVGEVPAHDEFRFESAGTLAERMPRLPHRFQYTQRDRLRKNIRRDLNAICCSRNVSEGEPTRVGRGRELRRVIGQHPGVVPE